jgi:hypothetical protein
MFAAERKSQLVYARAVNRGERECRAEHDPDLIRKVTRAPHGKEDYCGEYFKRL